MAHKVKFVDGKMTEKVRPAARRDGTTIRATQLYHNMGTRKGTMNVGDERNKIGDIGRLSAKISSSSTTLSTFIVRAYAVHYHKTSLTWFRVDNSTTVLKVWGTFIIF